MINFRRDRRFKDLTSAKDKYTALKKEEYRLRLVPRNYYSTKNYLFSTKFFLNVVKTVSDYNFCSENKSHRNSTYTTCGCNITTD